VSVTVASPTVTTVAVRLDRLPALLAARPNPYVGTLGVFLGAGIATLYGRLLSVGLPDLRGAMGLGFDEASWITTSYNMALMFMGPFSVYLGALLGARKVLVYSAPVFILALILLPFSPNLGVLFGLQVIAGLSSGTFYPLTMTYALRNLPMRYTIYGIGVYSIDILVVTNLSVPLEAWLVGHLSWRWIFWTGAVLTPIMAMCVLRAVPNPPKRTGPKPKISWRGFLYGSLSLGLIFGALDQGERLNWLNSGVIAGMLIAGAFLMGAAVVRRWVSPNPFINLPFLKSKNTLILAGSLFTFRFVLLSVALLIPAFLGAIQGYRPLETGRVLLWVAAPQLVMGFISARLMRWIDGRLLLAIGFATVALAALMNARLTSAWAGDNFWASQLVLSVGLSFTFVAMVGSLVQQAVDTGALYRPFDVLTYSAFVHTTRLFGGEVGTAFMQRVITLREEFHSNLIGLHVQTGNWLTDERLRMLTGGVLGGSSGIEEAQQRAATLLGGQVKQQAYTLAYQDCFIVIACACVVIIGLVALMRRMRIFFDSSSTEPPG
jgi:DHA2 family multidrug resistance protein